MIILIYHGVGRSSGTYKADPLSISRQLHRPFGRHRVAWVEYGRTIQGAEQG